MLASTPTQAGASSKERTSQAFSSSKVFPKKWASFKRRAREDENQDPAAAGQSTPSDTDGSSSKINSAALLHEVHQASLQIYPDALDEAIPCQHCRCAPSAHKMFDERYHNRYVDLCPDCAEKEQLRQDAGLMTCQVCLARKTTSEMSNIVTAATSGLSCLVDNPIGGLRVFLTDNGGNSWIPGIITKVNLAGFLPDMFSDAEPQTYDVMVDDGDRYIRVHAPFLRWLEKAAICTVCRPKAKKEQQDLMSRKHIQRRPSMVKRLLSGQIISSSRARGFSRRSLSRSMSRIRLLPPNANDAFRGNKRRAIAVLVFLVGLGLFLGGAIPCGAHRALQTRVVSVPCNVTSVVLEKAQCLGDGDGVMIDVTNEYIAEEQEETKGGGSSRRVRRHLRRNRPASEGCSELYRLTIGVEYFGEAKQQKISSGSKTWPTDEVIMESIEAANWVVGARIQCLFDPEDPSGELVLVFESIVGPLVFLIIGAVLLVGDLVGAAYFASVKK